MYATFARLHRLKAEFAALEAQLAAARQEVDTSNQSRITAESTWASQRQSLQDEAVTKQTALQANVAQLEQQLGEARTENARFVNILFDMARLCCLYACAL